VDEDDVLRADFLDELGVLGIVDVRAEGNLLDCESPRDGAALEGLDMIRLA
jgi:hypothetical protein